ncbi:protein rolling stone [Biomphalaria glabrata]
MKTTSRCAAFRMKLREQLNLRNVYLQHVDKDVFVSSKWKCPTFYLCWRLFWALYHSSWLAGNLIVTSLDDDLSTAKWFIYLSNWVYLLLTVECVLELAVVVWEVYGRSKTYSGPHLPMLIKVMWLLYVMSVTGAVMVCIWYWTSVHKGREITAIRLNTHGVAALYILLNMVVTRIPLRVLHFVYPVIFGVAYTLFSAIYYSMDGTNQTGDRYIYSVLDWSRPDRTLALSSLSNFVFIPIVHLVLCAFNLGLDKLHQRFCPPAITHDQSLNSFDSEKQMMT